MSIKNAYDQNDAMGLAKLVKTRKISPLELCEEAIRRIEKINPQLNAVIFKMYDAAKKAAKSKIPNGPFSGVPFLVKDLISAVEGVPLTSGCQALKNYIPDYDSELIKRFKQCGLIIIGKTNTPEFGLKNVTDPKLHGPTKNPWDPELSPGGSSGGSAAAVASGMVPMASGGDGGGSIRIPSSWCGLFGLKPSRGRNPTGPHHGEIWLGATVEHVLTRSVRDSAAMLDATCGSDPGSPYIIQPPIKPYLKEVNTNPGTLKIAFCTKSPLHTDVHPECITAVKEAAKLLEKCGHIIEEAEPPIDGIELALSYFTMYFGEIAADINEIKTLTGKNAAKNDIEPLSLIAGLLGKTISASDLVKAKRQWYNAGRRMGIFLNKYDLYLTPSTAFPPIKDNEAQPPLYEQIGMNIINTFKLGKLLLKSGIYKQFPMKLLAKTPFTQLANLTGLPAISVPLHWTRDGLPCGVHFTAPFGDEATLFRLAGQLEKAEPWFDRKPPIHA